MTIGDKIKNARLEKELLQKNLADLLTQNGRKTTNATISNWELNISEPDIDTLDLLCKILEKDANYFFDKEDISVQNVSFSSLDLSELDEVDIKNINEYIQMYKLAKIL